MPTGHLRKELPVRGRHRRNPHSARRCLSKRCQATGSNNAVLRLLFQSRLSKQDEARDAASFTELTSTISAMVAAATLEEKWQDVPARPEITSYESREGGKKDGGQLPSKLSEFVPASQSVGQPASQPTQPQVRRGGGSVFVSLSEPRWSPVERDTERDSSEDSDPLKVRLEDVKRRRLPFRLSVATRRLRSFFPQTCPTEWAQTLFPLATLLMSH